MEMEVLAVHVFPLTRLYLFTTKATSFIYNVCLYNACIYNVAHNIYLLLKMRIVLYVYNAIKKSKITINCHVFDILKYSKISK